tara:strand:+ start:1180 stop:2325 length:1146 start_codon:yes stop_codon:yes gene_type:complete
MKIGLIGAGRLGICLALLINEAGYEVLASDVREDYVNDLQNKKCGTTEPDVQEFLDRSRNIEFTTDNDRVILESDIIFTLVSTPSLEDGSYDVSNVDDVVGDFLRLGWSTTGENGSGLTGKSLVIGCTTNPGDCDVFQRRLVDDGVDVYYNPEFIAQGSIIKDLRHADMVLIGGNGHHAGVLEEIYEKIQDGFKEPSIHFMSTRAAELTKIAVNCFLTTKISYANQVGQVMIKDGMDAEVHTVLNAIGSDDRIGNKYLGFGFGFGGPCFPRDNRAFAAYAQSVGVQSAIGETTDNFNDEHTDFLRDYYLNKNKEELPFCFKYLTYKAGIDILTESRPHDLAVALLDEGYKVYCIDETCKDLVDKRIEFTAAPIEPVCWIDL